MSLSSPDTRGGGVNHHGGGGAIGVVIGNDGLVCCSAGRNTLSLGYTGRGTLRDNIVERVPACFITDIWDKERALAAGPFLGVARMTGG